MTTISTRTPADCDSAAHLVVDPAKFWASTHEFYVDDADYHHLARVLRVTTGDLVSVTDGRGAWVETVVGAQWSAQCLERSSEVTVVAKPNIISEIAFALTKADKPDLVIQKLTELGIDRVTPFVAERSIVRWDAQKAAKNLVRFEAIAREAVQQSRQVWLPVITPVCKFRELVAARTNDERQSKNVVVRCDRGGVSIDSLFASLPTNAGLEITLAIGPEGGWTQIERQLLPDAVSLTGNVLRAETAAIVAGALLVRAVGYADQ